MADLLELFKNLSNFYDHYLRWEEIEKIFENNSNKMADQNEEENEDNVEDDADEDDEDEVDEDEDEGIASSSSKRSDTPHSTIKRVEDIPMVKLAKKDPRVLSASQELCTMIRNIRESSSGYDNTYDCWDRVHEISPREKYFAFILSFLRLANYKPTSKLYRKLSMSAASLYILSLTIPGSKQFHIFDETMINYALEVFQLIDNIQNSEVAKKISKQDRVEIWVNFLNLCDDLKILFRYVHFDEYKNVRNSIIWELNKLMFNIHVNGYENIYAANLHSKCFEIYDEVINAHNGDPEETMMKIMRINYCLHIFPPNPRRREHFVSGSDAQLCEHISDWFISIINKYPRIVSKILKHYIECVITNPEKDWKSEQIQKALDYAAKYDSALYTKCNESIHKFVGRAINGEDTQTRINATDLSIRMLQISSKVNWELFRHEVSNVPREVFIIKDLICRLLDVNNTVKLRVLNGLHQAFIKGTEDTIRIMEEGIRYAVFNDSNIELPKEPRPRKDEIRYKRPDPLQPAYTFEGYQIIEPLFSKLPYTLYYLLRNPVANIRRASLLLIESIVKINPLIIYNTNFVKEISRLGQDPTAIVRKQALVAIDSILGEYPNCYLIIFAWCKIIVPLFKDNDLKLIEFAMECFKRRVFDNIGGIDKTNNAEHFMPWIILRVLLCSQHRLFLQHSINAAINTQIITPKVIALIESHTLTANSTEAWTMLSFIAGKVKSREPDSLISAFIKSMPDRSWNAGQNLQIILEVLTIHVQDFSHTALNMAFSCILTLMKDGNIPPCVISKAFNLCLTISIQSESKNTKEHPKGAQGSSHFQQRKKSPEILKWIEEVHNTAETYLLLNLKNFNSDRSKIFSYLFSYTESNLELAKYPNKGIINFVHKFLEAYIDSGESEFDPEDINALNLIIVLATRFSIRQSSICETTCNLFCQILKQTDRPPTVNNIIASMADLGKRHTQLIENCLGEIIRKLESPYVEIRLVTFKNLAQMVLQDLIRLRGNLLLSLTALLLDEDVEVSNRTTEFFLTYLEKKNPKLFHNCLIECPFVYNGYMHFNGFNSFSFCEKGIVSPLKGEEKKKSRQMLYTTFMYEHEDIALLMYFDNLKFIYSKLQSQDATLKSMEGRAMISDIIFILKEICITGLKQNNKNSHSQREQTEALDDIADVEMNDGTGVQENEASTSTSGPGKGRRRDRGLTMEDALMVVEKSIHLFPHVVRNILKLDPELTEPINELAVLMCIRFESIVENAQPTEFWTKYRDLAKNKQQELESAQRKSQKKQRNRKGSIDSHEQQDDAEVEAPQRRQINSMSILLDPFQG